MKFSIGKFHLVERSNLVSIISAIDLSFSIMGSRLLKRFGKQHWAKPRVLARELSFSFEFSLLLTGRLWNFVSSKVKGWESFEPLSGVLVGNFDDL